jgi:uncharacterized protein YndB with AHSA1/START domain
MEVSMNEHNSYHVSFLVKNPPEEVFDAINNVQGWWSQAIEGDTDRPGAVFHYHYQDVHRCSFQITEFVPGKKVVWHVLDNYFNFIKDKNEWIGTDVVFEIEWKGDQTEVRFTHVGLVPAYECYDVCSNAWGGYVTSSLRNLITTGEGQPNPIETVVDQARQMRGKGYTTSIIVDQSPQQVFEAVNRVRDWWSDDIEGQTDHLDAEFTFHSGDSHHSTQKITEWVSNEKVVWHVTSSQLNFVSDVSEWKDTDLIFEIARTGPKTELRFTHAGLVPALACYSDCSRGWSFLINQSLFNLITNGKGEPDRKNETALTSKETKPV